MFEAPPVTPAETPAEFLRKPVVEQPPLRPTPGPPAGPMSPVGASQSQYAPTRHQSVLSTPVAAGPLCPACGYRNGTHRVRCERCAAELWPGAASPARRRYAPPPPTPAPAPSRRIWPIVLAGAAVTVAAVIFVYALAYALGQR